MTAPTAEINCHNPALDAALACVRAGLSVVPIKRDGSKAPAAPWRQFQARPPTEAELHRWFDRADPPGVAVLGGAVSGGLECNDFDAQSESIYPQWRELVDAEAPGLVGRLCVIRTPRPGFHVRYRCTEATIPGNTKLAVDPALPKDERCLIETRGEGGYAIVPGSPPECHPSGRPYEHFAGPQLTDVQTIAGNDRETLLRCARSFDRAAAEAKDPTRADGAELRPGDDFNRRGPDWSEILTGWAVAREFCGKRYWRRPGKAEGWSATTGVCTSKNGVELFACFSENADPFQGANGGRPCTSYSRFSAYALLRHGGDYKAAAKELARQGYGDQTHKGNGHASHEGNGHADASTATFAGSQGKSAAADKHCTDKGNGRRVVERHGKDLHYCHAWKSWQVWDGRRWAEDGTGEALRRVKETQDSLYAWAAAELKAIGDEAKDADGEEDDGLKARRTTLKASLAHVLRWEDWRRTTASLSHAQSEPGVPILPDDLDRDPMLMNVQNGTIDLRTGRLLPHNRDDLITKIAPVSYDPAAQCPLWMRFLDRIMAGDQALIGYLQRVVGYCLTGDVREQLLWFLHGSGANGKSTFLRVLLDILGDYAIQAVSELLMVKAHESHPTERADLFGRRLVCTIETEEGKRMAEALMKQLTGGDKIKARKLYQDFFAFNPTHKILLAANHKPIFRGTDHAVWRRIKLVPFAVTIPETERDKALPEKLKRELPGILAWAVAGSGPARIKLIEG